MITQDFKEKDGILIFHDDITDEHTDYHANGLDGLYKAEEQHFWFISRKEFIFQQMKNVIDMSSKIIEIGAGTGNISRYLKSKAYSNIAVGEMHSKGLQYAKSYGIEKCYQFDLLRAPFKNEFDTICMFDVLEHIDNDILALANIHNTLKHNGHIVFTVPAHQWLWNRSDAVAGHKRRYTKKELIRKLKSSGFDIVVSRYFFISIVPLLWLRSLLHSDKKSTVSTGEYSKEIVINPFVSKVLLSLSRVENKINRFIPNLFGGSLLIIARKR